MTRDNEQKGQQARYTIDIRKKSVSRWKCLSTGITCSRGHGVSSHGDIYQGAVGYIRYMEAVYFSMQNLVVG